MARWGRHHKPIVAGASVLLIAAVAAVSVGIIVLGREQQKTEAQRLAAVREKIRADAKSTEATQKALDLRRRDAISRVNLAYREYLDDNVRAGRRALAWLP